MKANIHSNTPYVVSFVAKDTMKVSSSSIPPSFQESVPSGS